MTPLVQSDPTDNLPPPEEFHYEWTNPITLKLIWKEPRNPPDSCEILYEVKSLLDNSTKVNKQSVLTTKIICIVLLIMYIPIPSTTIDTSLGCMSITMQ